jgi:pimeloyl-ACP methyl ester carboxylesterase
VRTWRTSAAGHGLVVQEGGDPGAPAYVLVHGIGMSHRYLDPLAEHLARDFHVVVPDLPGFGSSPRPTHVLGIAEHAAVVRALVEDLGLSAPVLVGQSMGCQVVVEVMAASPGLASAAVLIGPVVDPQARSATRQALRLMRDGLHEPPRLHAILTADYLRTGPRRYGATVPHMLGYRIDERIREVAEPVLVVRGEHDPIAPARWVRDLADAAPRGTVAEVPGWGHNAMYPAPEVVGDLCRGVTC